MSALRVLVVDDDDLMREVMKDMLVFIGHEVFLACDGQEARQLVGHGAIFDVFISDTDMGPKEKGGLEFLRYVRSNHRTKDTPFILTSGRPYADDGTHMSVVVSLYGGPTEFMPKPIDLPQLFGLLHAKQAVGHY